MTKQNFGTNPGEYIKVPSRAKDSPLTVFDKPKSSLGHIPKKPMQRHIQLNIKDIPGASPKSLKNFKGVKRNDFFPNEPVTNRYYEREAHGGNTSMKGHFAVNDYSPWSSRVMQEHEKRHVKRFYPTINPPIEYPPGRN